MATKVRVEISVLSTGLMRGNISSQRGIPRERYRREREREKAMKVSGWVSLPCNEACRGYDWRVTQGTLLSQLSKCARMRLSVRQKTTRRQKEGWRGV